MDTRIVKRDLSKLTVANIDRVYSGKHGCMCGCLGNYYESGRMLTKVLNILKADSRAVVQDGYIIHVKDDLVCRDAGNNRTERNYVVYLKEGVDYWPVAVTAQAA